MPHFQIYNITEEFLLCLDALYEILDFLDDIRLALELDEDLSLLIHTPIVIPPAFDPFETIY
jgi:hypothetical protein